MNKALILSHLRNIPNFPAPGIQFKDVSTLFKDPVCFREILNELVALYKNRGITKVVGIESRGFIMGAALAAERAVRCGPRTTWYNRSTPRLRSLIFS